jgi:hypothetical protein
MSDIDITVALTAHTETVVGGPTMHSAEVAIRAAEAEGLRVERLIGFDAPSARCREFFGQPAFGGWKVMEVSFRDPYRTRNAMAEAARGKWIAFLDADDLFSENWLWRAAEVATGDLSGRIIVHPEVIWVFDRRSTVLIAPPEEDPLFLPSYLYFGNYYDMLAMAPRGVYSEVPYAPRDLAIGFGYQDWQWNVETMAAGWRHVTARDTIIFKRRRDMSVSVENVLRGCVVRNTEAMSIDFVEGLGRVTGARRVSTSPRPTRRSAADASTQGTNRPRGADRPRLPGPEG